MPTVAEVAAELPGSRVLGDGGAVVRGATHDSRAVQPGDLFCAVVGERADGQDFVGAAAVSGAAAVLVSRPVAGSPIPQILVDDVRAAMGPAASAVHGHPSRSLVVVGVTGTNGKTTTAHLLADVLERGGGMRTAVLGTLSGVRTTPEATELQGLLAGFRDDGHRAVVMEVSSHALALGRVEGCCFAAAVFTNFGRDHLDFHGTPERYFAAKAHLFTPALTAWAAVNIDDVRGRLLLEAAPIPMTGFSADDATGVEVGPTWHAYGWRGRRIRVGIGGRFNLMNSLAAATTASGLGLDDPQVVAGLGQASPVPGRFEPVVAGQDFAVVVDYAHTPEGLESVLSAARSAAGTNRVLVVFGCGGDRDRAKRPGMGAAATQGADAVVVTSDNPRDEDPARIIDGVLAGVRAEYRDRLLGVEPDRAAAIGTALRAARTGDVVVIAGKGHETTQTTGATTVPFDDRLVARQHLETLT